MYYFIFNGLLYKQIDDVAIGLPLEPSRANIFLSYHAMNKTGCIIACKDLSKFFIDVMSLIFLYSSNQMIN